MDSKPKYLLLFEDVLIPLIAYIWWEWTLYEILLFYLLDNLIKEFFVHIKSYQIQKFHHSKNKYWLYGGIKSVVLLIASMLMVHYAIFSINPQINLFKEFILFFKKEELGVAQGYFLIPMIIFAAYQSYRMEFMKPERYKVLTTKVLWDGHLIPHFLVIGSSCLCIGVSEFYVFPEYIYLLIILLFSILYVWFKK